MKAKVDEAEEINANVSDEICLNCSENKVKTHDLEAKIKSLEIKNSELLKDNKQLKHMLSHANRINLNKDILISQLSKSNGKKTGDNSEVNEKIAFVNFQHIFNSPELLTLRSIPSNSSRDSSFILQALRILYKENNSILNSRTLSSVCPGKQPISPQKKEILQEIYYERLELLGLDAIELNLRRSKLNTYISSSIVNIRKSLKRQSL